MTMAMTKSTVWIVDLVALVMHGVHDEHVHAGGSECTHVELLGVGPLGVLGLDDAGADDLDGFVTGTMTTGHVVICSTHETNAASQP